MDYKFCEECNDFHYGDSHKPEFNVYNEDYLGDEPKVFRAADFESAAIKFGEYYNSNGDYPLMNETIEVKVEKDGISKTFNVSAEPDIYYSASEIK